MNGSAVRKRIPFVFNPANDQDSQLILDEQGRKGALLAMLIMISSTQSKLSSSKALRQIMPLLTSTSGSPS